MSSELNKNPMNNREQRLCLSEKWILKKYGMKIQLDEKNVVVAKSEISNIYQAMHMKDPCTT